MDDIDLKWYLRDRWKRIREIEVEEARNRTFAQRMRDLDVLYNFAREHELTPRPDDAEKVRAIWNKLRDIDERKRRS